MSDLLPIERGGKEMSWLSAETRKQLILRLKDVVNQLMPFVHRKEIQYLTESQKEVQVLCEVLEMILLHGIKVKEFQGQIVFWGLLERLEVLTPPCLPLRNSVGAIACVSTLRTPIGKARGWIRQSLNAQSLEESVLFMISQIHNWISKFYVAEAILCQKEEGNMLLAVIRSLKIFSFNLKIDNDSLNTPSATISRMIQLQLQLATPSTTTTSSSTKSPLESAKLAASSSPSPSSSQPINSIDSFIKTFEFGLDKILTHVDQFLNISLDNDGAVANQSSLSAASTQLSGIKKIAPLFGSSLKDLLLDDQRCPHASLNPELGIPTQIVKLIQYIHHNAQTPNLFRQRISIHAIEELKKSIEAEKGIPSQCNIATVSFVLIQWLNQLPEPLLGYDRYSAILACAEVEDIRHRIRNLSLLVAETSWYNKPLLLMVLSLLSHCLLPENASQNNLNHIAIAVLCTPFLLRPPYDKPFYYLTQEDIDRLHMAATAAGSHLVEFIVDNYEQISQPVKEELTMKQIILSSKCYKIRQLQELLVLPFDISEVGSFDAEKLQMIYHLWNLLAPVERALNFNHESSNVVAAGNTSQSPSTVPSVPANAVSSISSTNGDAMNDSNSDQSSGLIGLTKQGLVSMEEILSHYRWDLCGLKVEKESLPLTEFSTAIGSIALQSFVTFLKKYEMRATNMIVDFQLNRREYCRLAQVILRMAHFTADVLYLFPPSPQLRRPSAIGTTGVTGSGTIAPIQYISKTLAWPLLSDENAFQEIFDVAFLCFDENWKNITERIGEFPSMETFSQALYRTRAMLWEIIAKNPLTTLQIWEHWTSLRLTEEERMFQMNSQKAAKGKSGSAGHSYILPQAKVKHLSLKGDSSNVTPPQSSSSSSSKQGSKKSSQSKGKSPDSSEEDDDDDFNDFDNPNDQFPLKKPSSFSFFSSGMNSNKNAFNQKNVNNQSIIEDITKALDSSSDEEILIPAAAPTVNVSSNPSGSIPAHSNQVPFVNNNVSTGILPIEGRNASKVPVVPSSTASSSKKDELSRNDAQMRSGKISQRIADLEVNDSIIDQSRPSSSFLPQLNTQSLAMRHYDNTGEINEYMNASMTAEMQKKELAAVWKKTFMGITTSVYGASKILSMKHIQQLEAALPPTHQCYDWKLLYRLSLHGASLTTMLNKAQSNSNTLLVVQDSRGAIFGAFVTEVMKFAERDKYYGNGTIGVWSFSSGSLKYYPWSYKNSYFMITSKECIAFGGGGNFALFLDSDLNRGTSGPCLTFSSPCLASEDEFQCISLELFAFQATTGLH